MKQNKKEEKDNEYEDYHRNKGSGSCQPHA